MNKDTVVASVIGFGLGLVAAIGLWVAPRLLPKSLPNSSPAAVAQVVESAQDTNKTPEQFEITSPTDGTISETNSVKITGKALKDDIVTISSVTQNAATKTDDSGLFESTINLAQGSNEIVISRYGTTGEENKHIFVFYYPEGI